MTKVRGLREDIQLGLALKQQMEQWLQHAIKTTNKHTTKIDSLTAQQKHNKIL